jgi:hypothetical protein
LIRVNLKRRAKRKWNQLTSKIDWFPNERKNNIY